MKRSQILLAGLGAVLLIALFYVLIFQPSREQLAVVEAEIATEQVMQQELTTEIARLRAVREQAPEAEAQLVAAEAIVPRDAALPSALRQLQLAADESGLVLAAVTTSRPVEFPDTADGLSSIAMNVQLEGGYFQVVDFLRRVEDPTISARGLNWSSANISVDEYPNLSVSLTGSIFALIASPPPAESEVPEATDADALEDDGTDEDVEIDVEIDVEVAP